MNLPEVTEDPQVAEGDFREAGFCLIANALTPAQVAAMSERLVEQALAEIAQGMDFRDGGAKQNWGDFYDENGRLRPDAFKVVGGGCNQRVWMLINKGGVFHQIFQVRPVRSIVDRFLGEEYLLSSFGANIAKPGGLAMPLHTDQWWMPSPTPRRRDPLPIGSMTRECFDVDALSELPMIAPLAAINVIWMLVDFTARNGATQLVPRSHLRGYQPNEAGEEEAVQPEAPAGTALVLDARTWHGTGAHTGRGDRLALLSTFCGPQFRQQENLTIGTRQEVIDEADEDLLGLLGFKVWNAYGRIESPVVEFVDRRETAPGVMKLSGRKNPL